MPANFHEGDREDPNTHQLIFGSWRLEQNWNAVPRDDAHVRRPTNRARDLRDYLRDYFNSPRGSVPWQEHMCFG